VLNDIASKTSLNIDFGGGIKSDEDVQIAFENGAKQITGGSIAILDPKLFNEWLSNYGPDKIILGADSNNRKIATHGWQKESKVDVVEFITDFEIKGVQLVICTDISKDGMLQGPSVELYKEILSKTGVSLIASGGITTIDDLHILQQIGCEGAIIGKAIYEGNISLKELREFIKNQNN
jgi:phosphoribosylformimino-5-aminoimidazole carboxamide ribotide isomerase